MGVVVTGASGFLGGYTVAALAMRGQSVNAVARRDPRRWRQKAPATVRTTVVSDYGMAPVSKSDVIVHLAEDATGGGSETDRMETVRLLLEKGARRFIYGSSAIVYGDGAKRPRSPLDKIAPRGAYAAAKCACEELVLATPGSVVVRLTNLYGPGMSERNVLSDILAGLATPGAIRIRDLAPVRDYLWVGDAAEGIADIAMGSSVGIFNLGTGKGTTVRDLAKAVAVASGQQKRVIEGSEIAHDSHLVVDYSAATAAFGWRPRVSLDEGIDLMIAGKNVPTPVNEAKK